MIVLRVILILCFSLNAKYMLIELDTNVDAVIREEPKLDRVTDFDDQKRGIPIARIVRSLGGNAGYKSLETASQHEKVWETFFRNHSQCNEKSVKCNYLDRCSPSRNNGEPCKNVKIGAWKGNKNIICARPHEIRPCRKKDKLKCGPIYYYFTKCTEQDSRKQQSCFCLDEAVVRKKHLRPSDECKDSSHCEYADFCSPQKHQDPCSKMQNVFVPNPKPSSKKYQPVLKIPMKCTSLTKNKMNDWDSPACTDNTDICSCQDSGLE